MFSKTNKQPVKAAPVDTNATSKKGIPSIISHGTNILGNIISDVVVDIDGTVEGNVRSDQVTIRANGRIAGDIVANSVHVYGEVRGLIRSHAVHLYSSAHVSGVIVHKSLTVEDGAFIDAKFKRIHEGADPQTASAGDDEAGDDGFIESTPSLSNGALRLIG